MDKYVIKGGRGLKGSVTISGSKNAALPILVSTLLTDEKCVINNVPDLADIESICQLLSHHGKKIERRGNTVIVHPSKITSAVAPYQIVRKIRASFLVSGPLLVRKHNTKVSLPGGCAIGARPVNIHLDAFETLGAKIQIKEGYVYLKADKLTSKKITFDFPSVGATENLMMTASLLPGITIIDNAAREPEIVDHADFLNKMGANISGAGTSTIVIEGKNKLSGAKHSVIPDRIETATYIIASAITCGDIEILNADISHLEQIVEKLRKAGVKITSEKNNTIRVKGIKNLRPISVQTGPYPGFPTDVQAQWMALMSVAKGKSIITESVFENRFLHAAELMRMGAKIEVKGNAVTIIGVNQLSGAPVMVSDLRAGAALVLAGLAAKGETTVNRIYHLDRGYEVLEKKLTKLGAKIKRLKS